jgi:hypothetical protein
MYTLLEGARDRAARLMFSDMPNEQARAWSP